MTASSYASDAKITEALAVLGADLIGQTEQTLLQQLVVAAALGGGGGGGGAATWGTITGTLSAQTDLQAALDAKLNLAGGTLTGPLTITGGTVTNSTPLLIMTQTWNDGTDVFKFDTKAVTNTASKAYSSTWADVSTVNEILVDGVAKFAFIPKGSENLPMLRLGGTDTDHPLLKDANTAGGLIVRMSSSIDYLCFGRFVDGTSGVCVAANGTNGRIGFNGTSNNMSGGNSTADAFFQRAAAASIQMGANHATTATHQTFKAHDVTTGAGADLILQGGAGSANDGYVKIGTATGGLAFFGASGSPLISGNINTNISSGGVGSALLDDTQSDGGLGGGAYTFGGLVAALKSYGIIG